MTAKPKKKIVRAPLGDCEVTQKVMDALNDIEKITEDGLKAVRITLSRMRFDASSHNDD